MSGDSGIGAEQKCLAFRHWYCVWLSGTNTFIVSGFPALVLKVSDSVWLSGTGTVSGFPALVPPQCLAFRHCCNVMSGWLVGIGSLLCVRFWRVVLVGLFS